MFFVYLRAPMPVTGITHHSKLSVHFKNLHNAGEMPLWGVVSGQVDIDPRKQLFTR